MTEQGNLVQEKREYVLTNADRCDKCGAQALVKAEGIGGEIFFCGHHFRAAEEKILAWAFMIVDEREKV
jgi:hypothetical protein